MDPTSASTTTPALPIPPSPPPRTPPSDDPITVENGFSSSEFVVTAVTLILMVLANVYHQDFSAYVQPISLGVSAVIVIGYQISRSIRKSAASAAAGARAVAEATARDSNAGSLPASSSITSGAGTPNPAPAGAGSTHKPLRQLPYADAAVATTAVSDRPDGGDGQPTTPVTFMESADIDQAQQAALATLMRAVQLVSQPATGKVVSTTLAG